MPDSANRGFETRFNFSLLKEKNGCRLKPVMNRRGSFFSKRAQTLKDDVRVQTPRDLSADYDETNFTTFILVVKD